MNEINSFLSIFKEECCPICYVEFAKNPAIMICTAQHLACKACHDHLEKVHRKCPECKQPFKADDYRQEYSAMRKLKEIGNMQQSMELGLPPFQSQIQIRIQKDIAVFRKMIIINSVLYYNMKQYKKAQKVLTSALNGKDQKIQISIISDYETQDFDPIIKTVLQLKGIKLICKLTEIYQLKEKSNNRKCKKPWSRQTFSTSKINPNDSFRPQPFSYKYFQTYYNQFKKQPKVQIYFYDLLTYYSSRPRQHKRLVNHFTFLKKHFDHPQRKIQMYANIGLIIYLSLEKEHFRAMEQLYNALKKQDFIEIINHCKNKVLIYFLKEAITSSLKKIRYWKLFDLLECRLREIPKIVNIDGMLLLAEQRSWEFWDAMVQTHYSGHPQFKLKMAASYLKRPNLKKKALRLYNEILQNKKANRTEVVALVKKSFTAEEEADFLQKEGYYRGEQYDSKILTEWRSIKRMLKKANDQINKESD